jgi:hypothetical protein
MAISDTQKVDFLWKKTIYGVANTGGSTKQGFEETIGSNVAVYGNAIMSQSVPVPAPNATGSVVQFYSKTTPIQMTVDPTASGNLAWVATATQGDLTSRLTNWIPPSIDAGYLVEVYRGNPNAGGVKLNGGTNNQEWVFDYNAGVLRFVNTLPAGVTATGANALYLVGHRYIGATGIGGAGVNLRDTAVEYEGNLLSEGTYSFINFFEFAPQAGTITIEVNGQRIESSQYSVSGRNLVLNLDTLPYDLEAGDIVSGRYAFAS